MMDGIFILAEVSQTEMSVEDIQIVPIGLIWEQIASLHWFHAVLALSFGIVYLLYGWRIFKVLSIICFGLIGLGFGMMIGETLGSELWGGVIGLLTLAILSMPLMKWGVSALGAIAGGVITGAIWYAIGLPQLYIWAGIIVGMVAGGMISFIVLEIAVMLFTSLGGSVITVVAILSLIHNYESNMIDPATSHIHDMVFDNTWFLPIALIGPTIFGIIMQNKLIKHSPKWEAKI